MIHIAQADSTDLDQLATLFDDYRAFYGQPGNFEECRTFLSERFSSREAILFKASIDHMIVGFTLLYPSFSSVAMAPIYILNDLFVKPEARKKGVASALLEKAVTHARETGAIRLQLETGNENTGAQALYEKLGWKRDSAYLHYSISI